MTDTAEAAPAPTIEPTVVAPVSAPVESTPTPGAGAEGQAASASATQPVSPSAAAEPVKADIPAAEAIPAAAAPTTVLGAEPAKTDAPKLDAPIPEIPKSEGEKPAEGSQSAEPAPLPTYESFTMPEGVTPDGTQLGEFTKMLGEYELISKADHAATQKLGQDLLNRHIADVKETVQRVTDGYVAAWNKQETDWLDAFKADPEIGGNRVNTTMKSVQEAVGKYAGTAEHTEEFRNFMETTKVGNNPALIRLINNMNGKIEGLLNKYERESSKPVPAMKAPSPPVSKIQKRYGSV